MDSAASNTSPIVKNVVTVFLTHRGRILLLQRSDRVGSYRGRWAGISGYVERNEAPIERAMKETSEEVSLATNDVSLVRAGQPFPVLDERINTLFLVHPFLFSTSNPQIRLDWEHAAYRWIGSEDLSRFDTVPKLDESLTRVTTDASILRSIHPTCVAMLTEIKEDRVRGASELSRRSLTAMTHLAELTQATMPKDLLAELKVFGIELMNSRPNMAPLTNLVGKLLYAAEGRAKSASDIEEFQHVVADTSERLIEDSVRAVHEIGTRASQLLHDGMTVFTHSRSATVLETLKTAIRTGVNIRVIVTESRPLCEGKVAAEDLCTLGIPVTLAVDAAAGQLMESADLCIVGADSVLSDGAVVNKVGTFSLALSAREYGKPFYVLCEKSKFNLRSIYEPQDEMEEMDSSEVLPYPHNALLNIRNPYFDRTPAGLIMKFITEEGEFSSHELQIVFRKMLAETYL